MQDLAGACLSVTLATYRNYKTGINIKLIVKVLRFFKILKIKPFCAKNS